MCQMPNIWHICHTNHKKRQISDVLNLIIFATCEQYRCKFATVRNRCGISFNHFLFSFLSPLSSLYSFLFSLILPQTSSISILFFFHSFFFSLSLLFPLPLSLTMPPPRPNAYLCCSVCLFFCGSIFCGFSFV